MRWDLVLEKREDARVLLRENVWAAADGLADLDHEALEAQDATIDALGIAAVMVAEASVVFLRRHALLSHRKNLVAGQDAGRCRRGIGKAENSVFAEAGQHFSHSFPGTPGPRMLVGQAYLRRERSFRAVSCVSKMRRSRAGPSRSSRMKAYRKWMARMPPQIPATHWINQPSFGVRTSIARISSITGMKTAR